MLILKHLRTIRHVSILIDRADDIAAVKYKADLKVLN